MAHGLDGPLGAQKGHDGFGEKEADRKEKEAENAAEKQRIGKDPVGAGVGLARQDGIAGRAPHPEHQPASMQEAVDRDGQV